MEERSRSLYTPAPNAIVNEKNRTADKARPIPTNRSKTIIMAYARCGTGGISILPRREKSARGVEMQLLRRSR